MPTTSRSAWSCEQCRRRKVRCDSKRPCVHCVRRNDNCTWSSTSEERDINGTRQDTAIIDLQDRVRRIEAILSEHGLSSAVSETPRSAQTARHTHTTTPGPDVNIEDLASAPANQALSTTVHIHDDFDHHIIATSPDASKRNNAGISSGQPQIARQAWHIIPDTLPSKVECDELLRSYCLNVEWIHHPLDVPEFRAKYDEFWLKSQSRGYEVEISDMQWLALLMIVLCLGSHFHPQRPSDELEEKLYAKSEECLRLSNHLANHSVVVIQTLICMV
jgi:hypothetical protein